ncbi:hypothetical protein TSUD_287900 [Trifolium subterraneum]|uniref:Reverse transcriptase domain-containing protein n=1 Tax=Trifolium subterraneum TaxID=3900 RepID=A0A2Z6NDN9_TRISU|nr:hypothetical protein TSUD_287900 [Trifolium subterraneum]
MLYCRGVSVPMHVLYAEDILIFCKRSIKNVCRVIHMAYSFGMLLYIVTYPFIDDILADIVPTFNMSDQLVWTSSKSGDLSAKEAFLHLYPPQQTLLRSSLV